MKKIFVLLIFGLISFNISAQYEKRLFPPAGEPENLHQLAIIMIASENTVVASTPTTVNDVTTPPPEVRWSITGIIFIILISVFVYICLRRYKHPH